MDISARMARPPCIKIILGLLGYYLAVQAFTYDMRFVNTILKSSLYIDEDDIIIGGFWKKLAYSLDHFIS